MLCESLLSCDVDASDLGFVDCGSDMEVVGKDLFKRLFFLRAT